MPCAPRAATLIDALTGFTAERTLVIDGRTYRGKVSAMPGDEILGRTWVSEPDGIRYPRYVELIRAADGKLLARSLTLWCPVDARTLKLLRPPPADLNEGFFHPPVRP